jgi:hypothetical protein
VRTIGDNVAAVRDRVAAACERTGRAATDVRVVAVSKHVPVPQIRAAVRAGIGEIGENRAQELRDKVPALAGEDVRWHYVGAIQTNKVRYLDPVVLVHGLDREGEAAALEDRGAETDRVWDVLIEVNVAGERSKQGVAPGEVEPLLEAIRALPRVRPRGFMIVAPRAEKAEDVRWVFARARHLRDRVRAAAGLRDGLEELSMGMSDDFEVAVEEGATILRIGRAIFREE